MRKLILSILAMLSLMVSTACGQAGKDRLTVRALHTEALRLAVTAVLGRTDALFVSKELQTEFQHFFILLVKMGRLRFRIALDLFDV